VKKASVIVSAVLLSIVLAFNFVSTLDENIVSNDKLNQIVLEFVVDLHCKLYQQCFDV